MNGRTIMAVVVGIILCAAGVLFSQSTPTEQIPQNGQPPLATVPFRIGGRVIKVERAVTGEQRTYGLSARSGLAKDTGMLFVFTSDDTYGFWMKDMRFPIDIMWLDASYKIVDMKERVTPATYPTVFYPSVPAWYVLEVPAGFVQEHGLSIGLSGEILEKVQ